MESSLACARLRHRLARRESGYRGTNKVKEEWRLPTSAGQEAQPDAAGMVSSRGGETG
jgi:hypothetical protein